MGSGNSSLSATGVQIGDTLLITGGGGFGFGGVLSDNGGHGGEPHSWLGGILRPLWFHSRRHHHARRRERPTGPASSPASAPPTLSTSPVPTFGDLGVGLGYRQRQPVDRYHHDHESLHNPRRAGHRQHLLRLGWQQLYESPHLRFDSGSDGHGRRGFDSGEIGSEPQLRVLFG